MIYNLSEQWHQTLQPIVINLVALSSSFFSTGIKHFNVLESMLENTIFLFEKLVQQALGRQLPFLFVKLYLLFLIYSS